MIKGCIFSVFLLLSMVLVQSCSHEHVLYVSPSGNDAGDGSERQPFATLQQAVDAASGLTGRVTIYLRDGFYSHEKTVIIHGNTAQRGGPQLTISSYPGEHVHLTGGRNIEGFTKIDESSPVWKKLPPQARGKVMFVDLKKQGITDYGQITPRGFGRPVTPSGLELYFDGSPMEMARWPNEDWAIIADVPESLDGKGFTYSGDRPARWTDAPDAWMHGYWKWDWSDSYVKIARIDLERKEIITEPPHSNYPFAKGKRYYAFNLIEELDAPGEWYLDRETGVLYFWPPSDPANAEIFVTLLRDPLIRLENTQQVTIKNLTLEYSCGAGVEIAGGADNLVENCTLRNMGTVAVSIGRLEPELSGKIYKNTLYNGNAGQNNGVSGCGIYNLGEGGIILGGGDRKTLAPGGNFVENNLIHDCSRWVRTYRAGVYMYGVGNIVRHNEIYDLPHTAVFFWGNEHILEYNLIHHVCMETGDAGAFYLGRDWTQRGSVIRYNYFHHLHGVEGHGGFTDVMAIYLDDWASGTTIYGNLFYKAGRSIMVGGGRDNVIENNLIIEGQPALHIDARGIGWAKYYFDGSNNTLFERLAAVNPDKPPYSEKYPQLMNIIDNHPEMPVGNCFEKNVSCGGRWRDLYNNLTDSIVCFKNNRHLDNCDFFNPDTDPVTINYDPAVFPEGFKRIPVEQIGIRKAP